nr:unnamed protein product [Digitaria exilis]CAB3504383.1 unnamed protein product [Digitaria exilis]
MARKVAMAGRSEIDRNGPAAAARAVARRKSRCARRRARERERDTAASASAPAASGGGQREPSSDAASSASRSCRRKDDGSSRWPLLPLPPCPPLPPPRRRWFLARRMAAQWESGFHNDRCMDLGSRNRHSWAEKSQLSGGGLDQRVE